MRPTSRPIVALVVVLLAACGAEPAASEPEPTGPATSPSTVPSTAATVAPPDPTDAVAGGRLAFLRDRELILLDMATGDETATGIVDLTPIALTTDGRSLIAYRVIPDNPHAVSVVRQALDGAGATVLAEAVPYGSAALSPDGRSLAFDGEDGIVLASLDRGEATQLAVEGGSTVWSPDGTHLAVERARPEGGSDLNVVDVATGATRQLTDDEWEDSPYAWTDDGSSVLTTSHRGGDGTKLAISVWEVDATSGEMTQRPGLETSVLDFALRSPDGRWDARVSDFGRLMITEPGRTVGTRIDSVDSSVHLTWSPNSAWLAWTTFTAPGESDLFMVHAPDGQPMQITRTPGAESHPVWGPVRHGF